MHILIVNQYALPAGASGITRHGDLGAELVRRGHTVTVVAARFNYLTRTRYDAGTTSEHGVTFRWIDSGTYAGNDARRVRSMLYFSAKALFGNLRLQPAPDVVIGSSPHPLAGLVAQLLAARYRVPFVFEVRDLWPSVLVELGALKAGGRSHRILEMLEKRLYAGAARIIILPPGVGRRVEELGERPEKCVHIPNATTILASGGVHMPESLAGILDEERGRDILMYTGAHGVSNDLRTVLDALVHLRGSDPDAYADLAVVFIGEGPEKARLQAVAAGQGHEHVHFHPPVAKNALPAAMELAAFFLVSFADAGVYRYGLSPNKLFDYMAVGRPILLASRLLDDPVQVFDVGFAYTPGDSASLSHRIGEVIRLTEDERAAMGARGRDAVQTNFSVRATASRLEDVLHDVVRERKDSGR